MSVLGHVSRAIVSHAVRVTATISSVRFVRLAAALLVTASGFQLIPEPLSAEESRDHDTMATQVEYSHRGDTAFGGKPMLSSMADVAVVVTGAGTWGVPATAEDAAKELESRDAILCGAYQADGGECSQESERFGEFLADFFEDVCGPGRVLGVWLICDEMGDLIEVRMYCWVQ